MSKDFQVEYRNFAGFLDGPSPRDLDDKHFCEALGYTFEDGVAVPTYGRDDYTGSQIVTGQRARKPFRWIRPDGTKMMLAYCNGGLWTETVYGNGVFTTLLSKVVTGGTAARVTTTVTFTGATNVDRTVRVGDYFYYNADGPAAGGLVATVTPTALLLSAYAGAATSGAYTIWRKLGSEISFAACGNQLLIADGSGPVHCYGETYEGSGSYEFREVGLPAPRVPAAITVGAGGNLTAGNYLVGIAFGDARGVISNCVEAPQFAAGLVNNKVTHSAIPSAPAWATRCWFYRSQMGDTSLYCSARDIATKYASLSYAAGPDETTFTLDAATIALRADLHINRYVTIRATGNQYRIKDNTTNTVVVAGNAGGEDPAGMMDIAGGWDLAQVQAGGWADVGADTDLDLDHPAPDENDQPPLGLKDIVSFRGGGRWAAWKGTLVYVSGRSSVASRPTGGRGNELTSGDGEIHYCLVYHDAGPGDGDAIVRIAKVGNTLTAFKGLSIWQLDDTDDYCDNWRFYPLDTLAGLAAPKSLFVVGDAALGLFRVAGRLDLGIFDGTKVRPIARHSTAQPGLSAVLASILNVTEPTGVVYQGYYYLSYTQTGTTNNRTLRYNLATHGWDLQPWGCGDFCEPFADTVEPTLLCGAPTDVGHLYKVVADDQDLDSDILRRLVTGEAVAEPDRDVSWDVVEIELEVTS